MSRAGEKRIGRFPARVGGGPRGYGVDEVLRVALAGSSLRNGGPHRFREGSCMQKTWKQAWLWRTGVPPWNCSTIRGHATCMPRSDCRVLLPPDSGLCSLESVSGDLLVRLPPYASCTIDAQSESGTVTAEGFELISRTESRNGFTAVLGKAAANCA